MASEYSQNIEYMKTHWWPNWGQNGKKCQYINPSSIENRNKTIIGTQIDN